MKRMKKIVSMLLAVIMVLGMSMTVFAAEKVVDSGKGGTGSITIQGSDAKNGVEGVGVAGKTFDVYKVLDAELANGADENGGVVYKVPTDLKTFYADRFGLDSAATGFDASVVAEISKMTNDSEELEAFAKAVLTAAEKYADLKMASVTAGEGDTSVTVKGLPLGYYVIEDVVGDGNTGEGAIPASALVLNTTTPDVTVKVKANAPSITKDIEENKLTCTKEVHTHGTDCFGADGALTCPKEVHVHTVECYGEEVEYVKYNDAAIGDTVKYSVKSQIPNMAGYEHYFFVVNDTMAKGLQFKDDVEIKIDGVVLEKDKQINGVPSGYTVTHSTNANQGTDIEIVLQNFIQYKGAENIGKVIEITYTAEVTKDVEVGPTGNVNEVGLKFPANHNENTWWDPANPDKPKPNVPVGETPKQKVITYVTGLELLKVDANTKNPLIGAEFSISGEALNKVLVKKETFTPSETGTYYKLKNGTYTEEIPDTSGTATDNSNLYDSTTQKYAKGTATEEEVTATDFTYSGVVDESGRLKIDGLREGTYTITEVKAPNGYNILTDSIIITIGCTYPTNLTPEGTETCTWSASATGAAGQPSIVNGVVSLTVENSTGALLPSTGGIGTTIFYVAGSILVLAAVVLLVAKKRMSAEK